MLKSQLNKNNLNSNRKSILGWINLNNQTAYIFIIAISCITIFFGYKAVQLKFNYDIESFFSKSDSDYILYQEHVERFGGENNFVLVGLKNNAGIDDLDFFQKVNSLTLDLESEDFVLQVLSLTNMSKKVITPMGIIMNIPFVHWEDEQRLKKDIAILYKNGNLTNFFLSNDQNSIAIFINKKSKSTKLEDKKFLTKLKSKLADSNFDEYHLGGRIVTQDFYVSKMRQEMFLFSGLGILLLLVFLYLTFRNIWGIIIPIIVLIISLIWTLGLMQLTGQYMSLMMVMMPTMLFVIGVSDSVHIINKFRSEYQISKNKHLAIYNTISEIGVAIFLTSFTTTIGFASLYFMNVEPLMKFGVYTAIGIMFTYLISIFIIPALLMILDINFPKEQKVRVNYMNSIEKLYYLITSHKKWFSIGIMAVIIISFYGLKFFRIDNNFLDDINDQTTLKKDMLFFENNFSGIVPFEIAIDIPDNSQLFDFNTLMEIEAVENFIIDKYQAGLIISPVTIIKTLNRSMNGGQNKSFKLPDNNGKLKKVLRKLNKWKIAEKYDDIVGSERKHARLTAKIKDLGSSRVGELNKQLAQFIRDENFSCKFTVTGVSHLLNKSNRDIAKGVVKGISVALIMMLITIAILFNSIKTAIVSLLPNLLPVLILAGLMGYLGIDLKVATSLMFTIVLGISVDDTIHILAKYRHQLKLNRKNEDALFIAFSSTGWSVLVTSIIISSGFIIFLSSSFQSTFYTGFLVSISLITAIFSNIIILPLLLGKEKMVINSLFLK